MKIQPIQNRRLHQLINSIGIDKETKAEMIYEATAGRSESSKGLSYREAEDLISQLALQEPKRDDKSDRMRKKIIALFREMGYVKGGKADMPRINNWVVKYGFKHVSLNSYSVKELPQLITQAEKVHQEFKIAIN